MYFCPGAVFLGLRLVVTFEGNLNDSTPRDINLLIYEFNASLTSLHRALTSNPIQTSLGRIGTEPSNNYSAQLLTELIIGKYKQPVLQTRHESTFKLCLLYYISACTQMLHEQMSVAVSSQPWKLKL